MIKNLFTPLPTVKTRKLIRIAGLVVLIFVVLIMLVIFGGNYAIDHYLNADGRKDISNYLPISGTATYEKASVKLFNSFPDVTIQLEGLKLTDSLTATHDYPPLTLDKLMVQASIKDLRQKQFEIEAVDLDGLTVNLYEDKHGYSNMANVMRQKIKQAVDENKKSETSVEFGDVDLTISNVILNKVDERIGQQAHISIEEIKVDNELINEQYQLALEMNNLLVSDELETNKDNHPIELEELLVEVQLNTSFSKLKVKGLKLTNGHIHLLTDSLGQSNYLSLFGNEQKQSNNKLDKKPGLAIDIDGVDIALHDIDFSMVDAMKYKHLEARIVKFETELQANADTSALVELELDVDQLAFNTRKGAYFRESLVKGQIQADVSHKLIKLSSLPLLINGEGFDVKANIYSDKNTATTLTVENGDVSTNLVRPLLTEAIQKSISTYDVRGPFSARAHVVFTPGKKDPRVTVDLQVNKKTVTAKGQSIKNAKLSATFINRLYDDARQFNENKKNVRFMIHDVVGTFNDFEISSQDALILSTPALGDRLIAKAQITGSAASASQYLKHDKFNFQQGNFTLFTDINGSLNNLDDLIAGTNLNLAMDDLEVHYPEGNTKFPFKILEIKKEGEKTEFHIEGFTANYQRPFHIHGEIDRVESLFFPGQEGSLQTEANIRASSVSWEGVIALFGKDGVFSSLKPSEEKQAKRSMKQTLTGIQQSFRPVIGIAIDTVFYGKDIQLIGFQSGIKFDDARTLVLEKTSFDVDGATVTLDGEVKINELDFTRFDFDVELRHLDLDVLMPKFDFFDINLLKQIHDQPDNLFVKMNLSGELDDDSGLRPETIHADITYESFAQDKFSGSIRLNANPTTKKVDVVFGHSGHPRSFNDILGTDTYRFDNGYYTISFQFDANFESTAQMVENSTFNLSIDNAEVYVTELGITVPLTRIEVASIKNKAYYHILLRSDTLNQEVAFNGIVNNVRHFAFEDTDKPYEIELEISSPKIVWHDLIKLFSFQQSGASTGGKILKQSLNQILADFNPDVTLKIDELEYSDQIRFNHIFAHAYQDGNTLYIDSANVAYGDSKVEVNIAANMGHEDVLPFHLGLKMLNIDVGKTLTHFDNFNVIQLREAKQIEGNVWLYVDMNAEINLEEKGFNTDKTEAYIAAELQNVVIEDLQTIDKIAEGIGREKRFEILRFAPIQTKIKVKGQRIEVKQTEIQANAIHAFVEGSIDKKSPENLWISVPISNIIAPNLEMVSEKTGYEGAGKKIYLQFISSEGEEDGNMKVYLRKKKFFKERFKLKQFRAYKRINRRERRRLRKEERQLKD